MDGPAENLESASHDDGSLALVRRSGFLFATTSVLLVALEGFEAVGLLSNPVQGGISFTVSICAAVVVVVSAMRLQTSARLHWGLYILIGTGSLYMLISWTEDLPFLDAIPILGQDDKTGRKMVKIALLALWFTSPPFLAWNMIAVHRRLTDALEDRIEQRTRHLSEANAHLHSEIKGHLATSNELTEAKKRLANLVKQRSQQLADVEEELVQHERLKALGRMASGVAHELNNTLTPARSFVELMMNDQDLTDEQRSSLECIDQSTADAVGIVQSLQQFHGGGASPRDRSNLDPCTMVREVIDLTRPMWKWAAEAEGKHISMQTHLDDNLTICANARELRQVLTNLILNSVTAIDERGTIRVELRHSNNTAEFRVIDDGRGMDAEQIKLCVEPFYTTRLDGTGLGLSVCNGIVEHHGGRLCIESTSGRGTTAAFSLPLVKRNTSEPDAPRRDGNEALSLKALYVEDDSGVRQSFSALLASIGVDVVSAESGMQALAACEDNVDFDVLIVDMGMPEMNGAETIAALTERGLRCPSIVISGWSVQSVTKRFGEHPLPDFILAKPTGSQDIRETLWEVRRMKHRTAG